VTIADVVAAVRKKRESALAGLSRVRRAPRAQRGFVQLPGALAAHERVAYEAAWQARVRLCDELLEELGEAS
jgi:hypothetical protein